MTQDRLATRKFKPGEAIFKEGQKGQEAFLIQEGYVSVWRTEDGRRVDLGTRSEGEIVGEMALIDDTERSATVSAGSEVTVQVITKKDLDAALSTAPDVLSSILGQLIESLRTSNDLVAMYASKLQELTSGKDSRPDD